MAAVVGRGPRAVRAAATAAVPAAGGDVTLQASAKVLTLFGIGAVLQRRGVIPEDAAKTCSKLLFTTFLPALYLSRLTPTLAGVSDLVTYAAIPAFALAHILTGGLLGFAVSRALGLRGGAARRVEVACGVHNCTSLPVLLLTSLLGAVEGARGVGLLSLYMLVWSPVLWTVGLFHLANYDVASVTGGKLSPVKLARTVLNPPLVAAIAAVVIARVPPLASLFVGPAAPLRFVTGAVDSLAEAAVPLSASVLAWTLAKSGGQKKQQESDTGADGGLESDEDGMTARQEKGSYVAVAFVRLVAAPACGLALFRAAEAAGFIPHTDCAFRLLLLLQSAMPSAQNLPTMALLNKKTEASAAPLARLMALQYAIAPLPLTLWAGVFMLEALRHVI